MGLGGSIRRAARRVTRSVGSSVSKITGNKIVQTGIGYSLGGFGGALVGGLYGNKAKKAVTQTYQYYSGHYARVQAREQQRLAREQQKEAERLERQQREYAFNQRKQQTDELRERVGASGSKFRTRTQDAKMSASLFGGSGNVETLG